jgi:hypothetical protein
VSLASLLKVVYLFSLAISPLQFGRPGDWPVSLRGQGEFKVGASRLEWSYLFIVFLFGLYFEL